MRFLVCAVLVAGCAHTGAQTLVMKHGAVRSESTTTGKGGAVRSTAQVKSHHGPHRTPVKAHFKSKPAHSPVPHHTATPDVWAALAQCESGDNFTDTSGGYFGAYQFTRSTWDSFDVEKFAPTANLATPAQQLVVARRVLARQGVSAWPTCGPRVGLKVGD